MLGPDQARAIVLQNVTVLPAETIPHEAALGRTMAQDIVSTLQLPLFDNSAMDGYAVRASDISTASATNPVRLRVLETTAAGIAPEYSVTSGACTKIMTGAPLPTGADAVVMREDTQAQPHNSQGEHSVSILAAAQAGQAVRRAGSDVRKGETVLQVGAVVRAAEWGMLAALGCAQIRVYRRPRVSILVTGDELVAVDAPLQAGQIHDSNSFTLRGLAENCGATVAQVRHVRDTVEAVRQALAACSDCDAVITSGGVSMGDFDAVRDVLHDSGEVHFWKVAMKPGKPILFATWRNIQYSVPVFGLPGNPVSVMVSFEQFVRPALLKMQGRDIFHRVTLPVQMAHAFDSPSGRTEYCRALVTPNVSNPGAWTATLSGDQGSGRLSTMTRANALLVVPPDTTKIEVGATLQAQMTDWPETRMENS